MQNLSSVAAILRRPPAGFKRSIRAANENGGRRVIVELKPPPTITTAEIEVFGALLADLELVAANDNEP
ncbi:hypothetical protein [Asticcacaulis taihuensis]|uniref:hypothetical protein n=1 Tax=Asticcacaulis taihuensis TaxID=260084 RepID=UPI003F7C02D8